MDRFIILIFVFLISIYSLTAKTDLKYTLEGNGMTEGSQIKLEVNRPTVIIIKLDSLEINRLKEIEGEDNFYTAADDLMWYNAMLLNKLDSLKIPVEYTDNDTVELETSDFTKTIIKDTTFSIYTYFYFDGIEIKRTDIFELLNKFAPAKGNTN